MAVRLALAALATLALAGPAWGQGSARIAALQTVLSAKGLYAGTIDGVNGAGTRAAVRRFQRRAGLTPDGVVGSKTRRALGRYGRHSIGSRVLHRGAYGWDVAALQFQLAWHGFPSGAFDGVFGPRVDSALRGFQEWAGLTADGRAGPATWQALRQPPAPCPIRLGWPLDGAIVEHVRPARQPVPRRSRHRRSRGGPRRRLARRTGRLRRLERRLRAARHPRAPSRRHDLLRASFAHPRHRRPAVVGGRHARPRRPHRQRHRAAPPFRGAAPRRVPRCSARFAVKSLRRQFAR